MGSIFNSIRVKITLALFLVVLSGVAVFETYKYEQYKNEALAKLEIQLSQKVDRLADSLVLPLWEIDHTWASTVIDHEITDKFIYAIIVDDEGALFEGRQRDENWLPMRSVNNIEGDYIVERQDVVREDEVIGSVKVYVTDAFILEDLKDKALIESMTVLLLAIAGLAVVLIMFSRMVIAPLQQLLKVTTAIAGGDYSHDVDLLQKDEIGQLGESVNTMKESIHLREAQVDAALANVRESETRFRLLVEHAADGIFIAGLDGRYVDVNSAGCRMLGFDRDELVGKTIMDLIPSEDAHRLNDSKEDMLEGETNISEWRLLRKDGSYLPVEVSANILPTGQWQAFVRDISDRKQAEEKIKRYSQAIEQSGEAVIITNQLGVIEHINPAFSVISGYTEQEALGKTPRILKSDHQSDEFYEEMWDTLVYGQTWQGKVINKKKDGEEYPAILTISPIKDENDVITHYVGIQQNMEKIEALEAQFHQAQKMEAVGTLVGGIAHDFNNTLAGITGNLYLAKKAVGENPDVVKRLDIVEKLSFSAAATIQQLLTFSRKGLVEMHPLSISSFLKETVKMQQSTLPENISLTLEVAATDMQVNGDINQLQQVLMNLINNGFDAVQDVENPSITIRLEQYRADSAFLVRNEEMDDGDYAAISVTDNGCGIKEEHLPHVFEPFFTTKELGKGTGLGLAMGYGALKTHGGVIEVEVTEVGVGTTIKLYLPLVELSGDTKLNKHEDEVISGNGELILLVDDNRTVLETGRDVLEGLGYQVLTAEDGLKAIELYSERKNDIDLLILDVVMPRLGGVEALKNIRDINPDVKAFFATGYDKLSALGVRGEKIDEKVISKPFAVSELSQCIRGVLES